MKKQFHVNTHGTQHLHYPVTVTFRVEVKVVSSLKVYATVTVTFVASVLAAILMKVV